MADKNIVWEIRIGSMWLEVTEDTFIKTMRMRYDYVFLCESKARIALFRDKHGRVVSKMSKMEV